MSVGGGNNPVLNFKFENVYEANFVSDRDNESDFWLGQDC